MIDNKDYYSLYEFNRHETIWQPINSIFETRQLILEDGGYAIGEDEFLLTSE